MTPTPRFLLVADRREGIWLVIDTARCVVMHPRPGDACERPEEVKKAIAFAAAADPGGGDADPAKPIPFTYAPHTDLG